MDRDLKKIIGVSAIVLILGGVGTLAAMWDNIFQFFIALFPFICEASKVALEEYLTSPYFIVGVIMSIASAIGIWFGVQGGRILFLIISIICEVASLVSILGNII